MGDRSGLQAGQYIIHILLLWSHTDVTHSECGSALSCWNKQGRPWRRRCLDGSICCSKTCMYLSAFMVPSQMCKLPMMPWAPTHPCTITILAFELCADNHQDGPFLFGPEDTTSMITKNNLKCGLDRPQNTFPLVNSDNWQWFSQVFLSQRGDMTEWCQFLMQCCLSDRRSWEFNVGIQPCRLHAEILWIFWWYYGL